jgi:hypothetical protein
MGHAEGPAKNKQIDGPPRTLLTKSQTHPPSDFFFPWLFFLVRFWAFLGKGSSKTPEGPKKKNKTGVYLADGQ